MYHFTFLLIYLKLCSLTKTNTINKTHTNVNAIIIQEFPFLEICVSHQVENIIKKVNKIHTWLYNVKEMTLSFN